MRRDLFLKIMNYEDFDRMPVVHWAGWEEWNQKLEQIGVSREEQSSYFDAEDFHLGSILQLTSGLYPPFEEEVLEETEEYRILRDGEGVVLKDFKGRSSIPQYIDHLLKDRSGLAEYKNRLKFSEGRLVESWSSVAQQLGRSGDLVILFTGSMIGWIRNWMGMENLATTLYDDPDMIRELIDDISDMVCALAERVAKDIRIDVGWFWEDICFRNGPLVSPRHFEELAGPGYRKITSTMKNLGVDLFAVDCDGVIDALIPTWLDAGVNIMFPLEVGVWNADPMECRKKFGKELRIIGGIDKRALSKTKKDIDEEVERRIPLMAEGGYFPLVDHLIPPEVSFENYRYYLDRIRDLRF